MIRNILTSACLLSSLVISTGHADEAIDPEALFAEAMKFRENGELFKSIEIFETIVSNQPSLNRARLELAVSYHLNRRFEEAKEQLTTVLNDENTPEAVKLAITAYLAQISSDLKTASKRSTSSIFVSAGLFTDSNINLGPTNDVIEARNLPASALEENGSGGQFMLSYSHRSRASKPMNIAQRSVDFEWLTQLTAYNKAYASGDSDFNLSVLTLNTGPALVADAAWRAALNVKLDKLYFGNDPYAEYLSINPFFTYSISQDMELTFENTTTVKEFDDPTNHSLLKGTATSWGIDLAKFYTSKGIGVQTGLKYHDNGAKAGRLHYTGAEVYLGGQMPAWTNANAYLTISGRNYKYQAIEDTITPTPSVKRDETELLVILGASHDFRSGPLKSWSLNAQYTFTDNDSNLADFTYDRNALEVNMRRYFF